MRTACLCLMIVAGYLCASCTTMEPSSPRSSSPSIQTGRSAGGAAGFTITASSVKADYPISGANFSVLGRNMRETFAGKEMLDRAAEGLDLSQTSTHSTFIERFKAERQKHPELNSLTITSLDIKDLPAH